MRLWSVLGSLPVLVPPRSQPKSFKSCIPDFSVQGKEVAITQPATILIDPTYLGESDIHWGGGEGREGA